MLTNHKQICFLDIDGVLNTDDEFGTTLNQEACNNLISLLKRIPTLRIVISSAWRSRGLNFVRSNLSRMGISRAKVIGATPMSFTNRIRGLEIQEYLDTHPEITNFVIFDDDQDMGDLSNHLVRTNPKVALTKQDIAQATKILSKEYENSK